MVILQYFNSRSNQYLNGALKEYGIDMSMGRALKEFGTDMTELAEMGKLDPAIGREKVIEQLVEALLKRRKSNACLVGEAGVGKTAIVEGLAINIARGSVPDKLKGKKIFSIDMGRMIAGTVFRGMLEQKFRDVLEEVHGGILFIDELHMIMMTGGKNADVVANLMKPALARGDFMFIGATTLEEYTKYIDGDAALKRRFVSIHVCEASRDESIQMVKGIIHKYEAHHGVIYTESAIVSAVDLSKNYIKERRLPDKALDLIDKAGARAQMLGKTYVNQAEIEQQLSTSTGIPVSSVSLSLISTSIEDNLKRNVIGQDEAVAAVSTCIRRAGAGIRDETKPIGCFLFTGPTGVGKTEMAKVVAKCYFGGAMVRLDMSEYNRESTVWRLIGSPPGYTSHDEGGQLTEQVRRRPHSLVLFDEIEKAHQQVFNVLLQILDEGRITDGKGNAVDFTNTIVILTSNVGSNSDQLRAVFKPELLNRFDQVVGFKSLEKEHIQKILEITIHEFRARLITNSKIQVAVSKGLKEWLLFKGYDKSYGARALKRAFVSTVQDKLAEEILNGTVAQRDNIIMDVTPNGELVCRPDSKIITRYGSGFKYYHHSIGLSQIVNFI